MSERTTLTTLKRHGTRYGYDKGCRCYYCTEAKLKHRRDQRAKARAENRPSYQRELAYGRALKETYRAARAGSAVAPTTGCDGPTKVRELCKHCAPAQNAYKWRGKGPMQTRLRAALADGPLRFREIGERLGVSNGYTANLTHRSVALGIIERVSRGLYRLPDQSGS